MGGGAQCVLLCLSLILEQFDVSRGELTADVQNGHVDVSCVMHACLFLLVHTSD